MFTKNKIVSDRRKAEVIKSCLEDDTFFVCHKTDNVCCNGFWNNFRNEFNLGRMAQRLNMVKFVNVDKRKDK